MDWGDGETDESLMLDSEDLFTINHKWKSTGNYLINLTAYDGQSESYSELIVKVDEIESGVAFNPLLLLAFIPLILFLLLRENNSYKKKKQKNGKK